MPSTDDLRGSEIRLLLPPAILLEEIPATEAALATIGDAREAIANILAGRDRRLVVVVGPCSVHDPDAAREYGARLVALARELASDLFIVMRTYFEKPRTVTDRKSTRLNSSHVKISYAVFCLKKKKK